VTLVAQAPDGVPEIREGDDLALVLSRHADVRDGDLVLVTSKVVSKAEGRVRTGDRDSALAAETVRVVARRGPTTIVRNRQGLTMAAAGIDASNVEAGRIVLLPEDPDGSARRLRQRIREVDDVNVGVIITDTAGRPWRTGQTDIAIGAAGVAVSESFAGRVDGHGNPLEVTEPAVADELAGAAELVSGKLGGRPLVVIRGRSDLVLPVGEDGPGAAALVRPDGGDLFGFGSREAVVAALSGRDAEVFGSPASAPDLARAVQEVLAGSVDVRVDADDAVSAYLSAPFDAELERLGVLAFAFGWDLAVDPVDGPAGIVLRFRPGCP
jgi:coenzyme F420-0:L-glutamate ligase/coenzyme F420-1:gamma-L-glutamate ligase